MIVLAPFANDKRFCFYHNNKQKLTLLLECVA
jgi:hypothetical protein